jgi:hypothetical protein
MPQSLFITGEAGSGKTRKLMEHAAVRGSQLVTKPHQRALAIAVMHGARRRLQTTLARHCPKLPATVSTIHSFALTLVNRWRRSLGLTLPVRVCEGGCGFAEKHWRTQASFDELIELACTALASPTVRRTLAETYPLVIVDEFQDCAAGTLRLVQALAEASTVLMAADHFQKLQNLDEGCPAVEWARAVAAAGDLVHEDLAGCRRTDSPAILRAARALRDNVRAEAATVPVYYAHNVGPAACRIVGRFLPWRQDRIGTGSCALLVPSLNDPLVPKLLASFAKQLGKRNPNRRVPWERAVSEAEQHKRLCEELGVEGSGGVWQRKTEGLGHLAKAVSRELVRLCRLRGLAEIPEDLAAQSARLAVHNSRAFGWNSPRFQVLTVHAAKNREFDHVFVFWTFKAEKWSDEEQRRLLYNAVTRAKLDCTVLVLGNEKSTCEDPVIGLLGPAQPAFDPAWKKGKPKAAGRT